MKNFVLGSLIASSMLLASSMSAQWLTNGTSIYYNGGRVGIGTSAPSNALHVVDPVNQGVGIFQNPSGRVGLGVDGSGGYLQADGINFSFFAGTKRVLFGSSANGRVGMGTTFPSAPLDVVSTEYYALRASTNFPGGTAMEIVNTGNNTGSWGIIAEATSGSAVIANGKYGVSATSVTANGAAITGAASALGSVAGRFTGNVEISGSISKGSGTFKIDHPLDPENKYLYHSFVESPEMMNIYDGIVTLDASGIGVVTMPAYFQALNRQFRYQLTCIGGYSPVYIASKINANQFTIAGGAPGLEVSWMVTGVRHDRFAAKNRVQVEVEKAPEERGFYLHPEAFDMTSDRAIPSIRRDLSAGAGKKDRLRQ